MKQIFPNGELQIIQLSRKDISIILDLLRCYLQLTLIYSLVQSHFNVSLPYCVCVVIILHRWFEKLSINYLKRLDTLISQLGYPVQCPITLWGPIKICFHMSSTVQYSFASFSAPPDSLFYVLRRQNWAKCKHGQREEDLTIKFNGNTLSAEPGKRTQVGQLPDFPPRNERNVQVHRFISVARTLDINCRSTYGQVPAGKMLLPVTPPFHLSSPHARFAWFRCTAGATCLVSSKKILISFNRK